jgi:hypothetical protein
MISKKIDIIQKLCFRFRSAALRSNPAGRRPRAIRNRKLKLDPHCGYPETKRAQDGIVQLESIATSDSPRTKGKRRKEIGTTWQALHQPDILPSP